MNMQETEYINVYGARVHNLKDIDAEIPRNSLTVITGLSGSGKSSLAFDTILLCMIFRAEKHCLLFYLQL